MTEAQKVYELEAPPVIEPSRSLWSEKFSEIACGMQLGDQIRIIGLRVGEKVPLDEQHKFRAEIDLENGVLTLTLTAYSRKHLGCLDEVGMIF